jgi:2-dehydropantoate 2-reductase
VIVPLYNGVDAFEKIRGLFPQALVCSACIYIVSFIQGPGVIRINGNKQIVHIGSDSIEKDRLLRVQKILTDAGIPCHVSENIQKTVWEKFLFISCIASLTSYLDISIGAIIENPEHSKLLQAMFLEFMEVAKAYGVELEEDLIHKSFERMATMPYASTSSMHNDYKKGGKTEYLSLTAYMVNLGNALRIDTPNFDRMLQGLEQRNTLH